MSATIKCRESIRKDIIDYLLKEMGNLMSSIRKDSDAVVVDEFEGGLEIAFPIGEVYGYASDYVQNIASRIFPAGGNFNHETDTRALIIITN